MNSTLEVEVIGCDDGGYTLYDRKTGQGLVSVDSFAEVEAAFIQLIQEFAGEYDA